MRNILKKLALVPHTPYTITDRAAFLRRHGTEAAR